MKSLGIKFLVLLGALGLFFSLAFAEEIRYDNPEIRDPFVPLKNPQAEGDAGLQDALAVEGIVYDPRAGSYAVIGGEIYKEGEEFQGTKIVRIMPDRVVFYQENEEVVSWLREEGVNEKKEV